jgi:hypothetical protein
MFLDIAVRHFTTTAKTLRGVRAWAMTEAAPLRRRHCIRRIRRRDQSARDEFVIEASNSYPEGFSQSRCADRVASPEPRVFPNRKGKKTSLSLSVFGMRRQQEARVDLHCFCGHTADTGFVQNRQIALSY